MRGFWSRLFNRQCEHPHVLVVTSVGVRRSICEDCGHISFTIREMIQPTTPLAKTRGGDDLPQAEGF